MSPNLRPRPKDEKKHSIAVIHKENYEIAKLTLIANDVTSELEKVTTNRRYFNYTEKSLKPKTQEEMEEEEKAARIKNLKRK